MSDVALLVRNALHDQVPLRLERAPAWEDVVARAGVSGRRPLSRRRGRRLLLAVAVALLVLIVAGTALAALGVGPFDRLSSWLRDAPGKQAPRAEQNGFSARNASSFASFPPNTRLRLLARASVAGRTFALLGFRDGSALCLRLVPARQPSSLGVNQCVPLRDLTSSEAPALVASTGHFGLNTKHPIDAIFGFGNDRVRAIEVRHSRGDVDVAPVLSNAFVSLHTASTDADYDPIVTVVARTRDGRESAVPFSPALGAVAPHGVPSYVKAVPAQLGGPAVPVAAAHPSTIAWLARRAPRGRPFALNARFLEFLDGTSVFSRAVQPDSGDPYRLGISLVRVGSHPQSPITASLSAGVRTKLRPGGLLLCLSEFFPLRPTPRAALCGTASRSGWSPQAKGALITRFMYRELFTRVSGLASDDVRSIRLVLLGGRVVPVALRDNVYTVEAPSGDFPAKLVGYDAKHRPIAVAVVPSRDRYVVAPCPAVRAARESTPARPYERLDLRTGNVSGSPILGSTPSQVEAALGPPDSVSPPHLTSAMTARGLSWGATRFGTPILTVTFHRTGKTFRAVVLQFWGSNVTDPRLGRVLQLQPAELQRRIESVYDSTYALRIAYGSRPRTWGCGASLANRPHGFLLSFGPDLYPTRRGRPSLTLLRRTRGSA